MPATRTKTKILIDGGDPTETSKIKGLIGFVDGQTTNPSLIAKNPEIRKLIASGHRLSRQEQNEEYKNIVRQISPLVGDAGLLAPLFDHLPKVIERSQYTDGDGAAKDAVHRVGW